MKAADLQPAPQERQVFDRAHLKHVPRVAGCYVLTAYDGQILYIGLATQLPQRMSSHLDTPAKVLPNAKGRAHWFWFHRCKDALEANRLERGWLNQHDLQTGGLPVLNRVHSPVS